MASIGMGAGEACEHMLAYARDCVEKHTVFSMLDTL